MSLILEQDISKAENKWLNKLYEFIKFSFAQYRLPSHDETHCLRSWVFAKKLFYAIDHLNIPIPYSDIENALIAIFFHDLGMTESLHSEHGQISKQHCEKYFHKNSKLKPKGLEDILNAIEVHDDKSYTNVQNKSLPSSVFSILPAADDLDALGYAGIFRYWEIYTLRKIPENEVPEKVLANLEARYSYFSTRFSFLNSFLSEQQKRYEIIKSFYTDVEKALKNSGSHVHAHDAQIVLEYFDKLVRTDGKGPDEIFSIVEQDCKDQKILGFLNNLKKEWLSGVELLL
ncbi:MAG: hypothetical protein U9N53_05070 [Bacteroidota bacterium]|nr:hypothetical protein [Bacteroidota bacterium]